MKKRIAILGSTGSIGTQALEIIKNHNNKFVAEIITANNNADLLVKQAREFEPNLVIIANEDKYDFVSSQLEDLPIKVYTGNDAISQSVKNEEIDIVLTAMVGFSGLEPTISAIKAGKHIALANKETMVVAGELITRLSRENKVNILPVDSEHSAIFQSLTGEIGNKIEKIILTASGGPFREFSKEELKIVTVSDALDHPTWNMGNKITIDSATLMNKGFEAIEAKWLFGVKPEQIEVVVHPQSIIHSMVQFEDSSVKSQMGLPDMRLPILYAFSFPQRIKTDFERMDLIKTGELNFYEPDTDKFPCLNLAYNSMQRGGNIPCMLNAANDLLVEKFLAGEISFMDIPAIIKYVLNRDDMIIKNPDYNDLVNTNNEVHKLIIKNIKTLLK